MNYKQKKKKERKEHKKIKIHFSNKDNIYIEKKIAIYLSKMVRTVSQLIYRLLITNTGTIIISNS